MLHYFSNLIKKNLLNLKYLSTIRLIEEIAYDTTNDKLIKKLKKANLKTLNQDISEWYNFNFSSYHYKNGQSPATVLEAILMYSDEKVLKVFLDKNTQLDINYHNPLSKIFQRSIAKDKIKPANITIMAQMLLDKGLNIHWTEKNEDYAVFNNKIHNYINEAIMACVNYTNVGHYEMNPQFTKLLYSLIDAGLKKQDETGQLIQTTILIGNNELTDIVLNLEGVNEEYIKKGIEISLHHLSTNESAMFQPIVIKNKASIEYLNMYLEKKSLEKLSVVNNNKILPKKQKI